MKHGVCSKVFGYSNISNPEYSNRIFRTNPSPNPMILSHECCISDNDDDDDYYFTYFYTVVRPKALAGFWVHYTIIT